MFVSFGTALFFFTDQLFDWQIKLLQSQRLRRAYRFLGAIFIAASIAAGLALAWTLATHGVT